MARHTAESGKKRRSAALAARRQADRHAPQQHLLALQGLADDEIRAILTQTKSFDQAEPDVRFNDLLRVTVVNLFFEDSTRTRISFTVAARRLGAEVVDLTGAGSSASKGESLVDTARTIEAMGVGALVVRDRVVGAAHLIAKAVRCPVINAGDGRHEHPTQGLLDAYALAEAHGRLSDFDLTGLHVAIVGDIINSRVARSNIAAMTALGARIVCVGPPSLAPDSLAALGCEVAHDLDETLPTVDAVQTLRVQVERGANVGSLRQYVAGYQLSEARAARMKPDAIVMHPGPMNRGVEIASAVADGPRSRILRQVEIGVATRMAVLKHCLGRDVARR